jgi:predicted Fe-Mo cluster-binding NifX family protein
MIIAIPVWENRVSPLFDSSAHLLVVEGDVMKIDKKEIISVESLTLFQRIDLLKKLNIDILFCGGITKPILENIRNKNIKVIPFVCGDANLILDAALRGKDIKSQFSMPGDAEEKEN